MEIIITGTSKEIAALVLEIQERQAEQRFEIKLDGNKVAESIFKNMNKFNPA